MSPKKQVKYFKSTVEHPNGFSKDSNLEKLINKWVNKSDVFVIDIKFVNEYNAFVIYENFPKES